MIAKDNILKITDDRPDPKLRIFKGSIDFDLIELRKYQPYKLRRQHDKTVYGLDTETLHGYAKLIADNDGDHSYIMNIDDALKFLTSKKFRNAHNFFYNIHFDINAIIKYLPEEQIKELNDTLKTTYKHYEIFYIPRKIFRIICYNHVHKFYDISQFFGGSLEFNARKYLGKEKYLEPMDGATLGSSPEFWADNFEKIVEYCINDCKLTKGLGQMLYNTLKDNIGLKPNAFTSEAGLTKEFVRTFTDIPDLLQVPINAIKYAFYSYAGGRFEVVKKGNVGTCSLYDINSAYPYHIRDLVDITMGQWKWTRDLHEEATYGFYFVKFMTKYNKISPINMKLPNNTLCYPMINGYKYITKNELLAYDKFLDYEIIDGWEFFASSQAGKPFENYINHVFERKKATPKDRYEYKSYKILMNGLYGCFWEKHKSKIDEKITVGKLFNPIYASVITANTRIQLWHYALKDLNNFVGFATDSVLFQGTPDLPTSPELGEWSLEKVGKTNVLRSGFYKIDDIIKARGIKKGVRIRSPTGEYDTFYDYILDQPTWTKYPVISNRPLSFSECLHKHKKFTMEDINMFIDQEYVIDINRDFKRIWNRDFKEGIELLHDSIDSEPLILYN